jgi:hypothetical protein
MGSGIGFQFPTPELTWWTHARRSPFRSISPSLEGPLAASQLGNLLYFSVTFAEARPHSQGVVIILAKK